MTNELKSQKNITPTQYEIQFVTEQIREGVLKGEYKDEEKTITWKTNIEIIILKSEHQ